MWLTAIRPSTCHPQSFARQSLGDAIFCEASVLSTVREK